MATVLLVDNDEARSASLKDLLEKHGYDAMVYAPNSGDVSELRGDPADAIFLAPGVIANPLANPSGRFVFSDPEYVDRRRLDIILLFGMQQFYGRQPSYFVGALSEN